MVHVLGAVTVLPRGHEAAEAMRWGLLGGLVLLSLLTLISLPWRKGRRGGLVIGRDRRVSTSKTVASVWTFVVATGLLGIVYARLAGHGGPLQATARSGLVGQYALLFGGPLGAAIAAKGIVSKQLEANPEAKAESKTGAKPSDLISSDDGEAELADFQYIAFNLVALVYVIGSLWHDPAHGLPHIPDVLLGLTSVSAVGYVGRKALNPPGVATANMEAVKDSQPPEVKIAVTGLQPAEQKRAPMWVRFGDDNPGTTRSVDVNGGTAVIEVPVFEPAPKPPAGTETPVTVTTAAGTVIAAGNHTY
jgi:hypothetical protein